MSLSNHFGVLGDSQAEQDWCTVETRKQRRRIRKIDSNQISEIKKPKSSTTPSPRKSFTDQLLKKYSGRFKESNIIKVCGTLLADVDEDTLNNPVEFGALQKRVVERVGILEQEALFSTLYGSKQEDGEEEEHFHQPIVNADDTQDSEEVVPIDDEEKESLHTAMNAKANEISTENPYPEEDVDEEEKHTSETEANRSAYEDDIRDAAPMAGEEVFREPTPAKTLPQILAEQAKDFDITTLAGVELVSEWCRNLKQGGETGREYRVAFNQSIILRTIVKTLLTVTSNGEIPGAEDTIELFHLILQGNNEYHRWLYKQIRKLADFISKTAKKTDPTWLAFLSNQAFALVDAQKEQDRMVESKQPRALVGFTLPSTHIVTDGDDRLKLQSEQADILCQDMFSTLHDLQAKDDELMSMNPTANTEFKGRYTQIQSHLNEHISKAKAHVTAQARQLEKINESFKGNERRTKELIQPIEKQLREIQQSSDQAKKEINEYELRLKAAREKLAELDKSKTLLKSRISKIQAAHHPQKADFIKQRANSQFKLHSARREHTCYIHVQHIAAESYKHLESWSQCTIIQERESRRALLQRYYDSVEKYVCTLFSILHRLGQRVGFMKQSLQRNSDECDRRKQLFGRSHSTMDLCMAADKEKMDTDLKMIDKLQTEVDNIIQKSFASATKWGIYEQIFNDLWHKIRSMAAKYKVNMNSFVKLKIDPGMMSMMNSDGHNVEQPYSQHKGTIAQGGEHVQVNQVYNGQTMQPLIQDLQGSQFQKPGSHRPSGQLQPHLPQIVPQKHSQGAQHNNQQPLKIINNATNKKYDLQQQKTRDLYVNTVQGRPIIKNHNGSPSIKPPMQESNIQFNKQRHARSTTPWGRHYSQ